MIVGLSSKEGNLNEADLSDYFARNIVEELRRIEGVGKVQLFGAEKAMRYGSIRPAAITTLSMSDVTTAVAQQNIQIAPGAIGSSPAMTGQRVTFPLEAWTVRNAGPVWLYRFAR
jgi:multidrug efflux pump